MKKYPFDIKKPQMLLEVQTSNPPDTKIFLQIIPCLFPCAYFCHPSCDQLPRYLEDFVSLWLVRLDEALKSFYGNPVSEKSIHHSSAIRQKIAIGVPPKLTSGCVRRDS